MNQVVQQSNMYTIEQYVGQERVALLELFRLNVPLYFATEEEKDLHMFLDNHAQDFYLCKNNNVLVGCGGHNMKDNLGVLSWYIVHPQYQGKGVGRLLVQHNLNLLKQKGFKHIRVRTSQLADKFYEKFGFNLIHTQKDYWAKGLDLYEMEMFI
jgi:ribosomal-protein-alanine N-acetyltransferase